MADTTYYVDTDVSGGAGDGSSWANAYSSLSAAENAVDGDITAVGIITFLCRGSTNADTTAVTVDGWTVDSTHYIKIEADSEDRHAGKWSTSKYRLAITATYNYPLLIEENYTQVNWLQIGRAVGESNRPVVLYNGGTNGLIQGCLIKQQSGVDGNAVQFNAGDGVIRNCIVYDATNGVGVLANSGTITAQNVTVVNCSTGFERGTGTFNCTNCGASGCTTAFSSVSSQTTCSSTTPTFVDGDNDDYHLASDDETWHDQGTDLSGTFTVDIDGETRVTWDIGADEYVAPAGGSIPRSNPFSRPFSQSLGRGGF
jgi:hypothetical protein